MGVCLGGATPVPALEAMLHATGFIDVAVVPGEQSRAVIEERAPGTRAEEAIVSASILARKPGGWSVSGLHRRRGTMHLPHGGPRRCAR
jgi:hypothetical protein